MSDTAIENSIEEAAPAWLEAGRAWEHAAGDWANLFEPYARDAVEAVFAATAVGPDTRLLDVACGSGLALARAERLGATVTGIDAAPGLIDIARRRAPSADARAGDMFALPFDDESFDVVTSFNGIWGGCQDAVAEIARVLRPGGLVGISFWGRAEALGLRDYFIAVGSAHPAVGAEMIELASIGAPGQAESMLAEAGLETIDRATTDARLEWPDDEIALRGLRSPGVTLPAIEALGDEAFATTVMAAVAPFRADDGSYLISNELTHVIARKS